MIDLLVNTNPPRGYEDGMFIFAVSEAGTHFLQKKYPKAFDTSEDCKYNQWSSLSSIDTFVELECIMDDTIFITELQGSGMVVKFE